MLVVTDPAGNLDIYFDFLAAIAGCISHGRRKRLNREKVGQDFLLACDESKKMLAVVSSDKVRTLLRTVDMPLLITCLLFTALVECFRL